MEKVKSLLLYFILLFIQFASLNSQQQYTSPQKYFINCGSKSDVTLYNRTFTGDVNSRKFSGSHVVTATSTNSILPLYQTARVFNSNSSYYPLHSDIDGTYVVRLHFYPFSSPKFNLIEANFSVFFDSGFPLLSNFGVKSIADLPVITEFIFYVGFRNFGLTFIPQKSSFAFLNAVEMFVAPSGYVPNSTFYVTPAGTVRTNYSDFSTQIIRPVHRINVGGQVLDPDSDILWRNWVPDDEFLYDKKSAKNSSFYAISPQYPPGGATEYSAPPLVYRTAKQSHDLASVTWQFNVTRNAKHFIRAHFCDIIHDHVDSSKFNFSIYSKYKFRVSPYDEIHQLGAPTLGAPFYYDFVTDSDNSGFLNISIGPSGDSVNETPFLNGIEIMVMRNGSTGETKPDKKNKSHLIEIIGWVLGGVALVLLMLVIFWICCRRAKAKPVENIDCPLVNLCDTHSYTGLTERTGSVLSNLNLGLKVAFSDIMYATNNFDPDLMIGQGGFGKVYKGTFRSGLQVAVKRSDSGNGQGFPEFQAEIMILSSIRHRHLVALIGYCDEMSEMILVYEFMENGTLREHLYEKSATKSSMLSSLSWNQRLDICIGAAKGLHYLHTGSGGEIIHRDVKSTNILLDKDFVAKVSDFGLSRSGLPDQTHISTDVKGTFGYLDPEYCRWMQLTQKSDVYSFGVVLLEVLCARPVINKLLPRDQVYLADLGVSWQQKGQLEKIIDPFLVGKIIPNSLRKFGETAVKCLNECGADRPSMVEVMWDLEYALQLQHQVVREPHEDSNTDVSWAMKVPSFQRLPSTGTFNEESEMPLGFDSILDSSYADEEVEMPQGFNYILDSSYENATDVFSQLRVNDAR